MGLFIDVEGVSMFDGRSGGFGCNGFGIGKPFFWRGKDKNETNDAQNIPLPGCTVVVPIDHVL